MAYSEAQKNEIVNTVCERIANGESVRAILKDDNLPSFRHFLVWISEDEVKGKQYARAMEIRSDVLFEEILDIADEAENDFFVDEKTGNEKFNQEAVQRSKLRVDSRKWYLSKLNPKKFGDKIDANLNHEGKIQIEQITGMVIK